MSDFLCERIQQMSSGQRQKVMGDLGITLVDEVAEDTIDSIYAFLSSALKKIDILSSEELAVLAVRLDFDSAGMSRRDIVSALQQIIEKDVLNGSGTALVKLSLSENKHTDEELSDKTIPELRGIAADLGIDYANIKKKTEFISAIKKARKALAKRVVKNIQKVGTCPRLHEEKGLDLSNKTVKELKEIAKQRGVPQLYKLTTRAKLLEALGDVVQEIQHAREEEHIPSEKEGVADDLSSKNVKQLKELAKERGIVGFYKLKRDELLAALAPVRRPRSPVRHVSPVRVSPVRHAVVEEQLLDLTNKNVKELKELAKERGIKGFHKLRRDELLAALVPPRRGQSPVRVSPVKQAIIQEAVILDLASKNVKQLKELAKERGIAGFSKLRRDELLAALAPSHLSPQVVQQKVERIEEQVEEIRHVIENQEALNISPQKVQELEKVLDRLEDVQEVVEQQAAIESRRASPVRADIVVKDRTAYIDDVLQNIQVPKTDMYLRDVSGKILKCLSMY